MLQIIKQNKKIFYSFLFSAEDFMPEFGGSIESNELNNSTDKLSYIPDNILPRIDKKAK